MPAQSRPSYEGRPLARPDEELVDQGLSFDVTTLLSRRRMFKAFGLGAATLGLAACGVNSTSAVTSSPSSAAASTSAGSAAAGTLSEIPDETNGPYPGDGTNGPDVLTESGIIRGDIRSSFGTSTTTAEGVPITLRLNLYNIQGGRQVPYAGAAVYVWHCDRDGKYSMYSAGLENENYLRGVQVADANGTVTFTSIYPACYDGRWPHIHFEVYPDQDSIPDAGNAIATSQVAMPQDVCSTVYATSGYEQSRTNLSKVSLTGDNVFGDDGGVTQIPTVSGDVTGGYTVALTAAVDTTTTPTGGSMGGGPGGGGAPPSR